jgi:hypothetical protein
MKTVNIGMSTGGYKMFHNFGATLNFKCTNDINVIISIKLEVNKDFNNITRLPGAKTIFVCLVVWFFSSSSNYIAWNTLS